MTTHQVRVTYTAAHWTLDDETAFYTFDDIDEADRAARFYINQPDVVRVVLVPDLEA